MVIFFVEVAFEWWLEVWNVSGVVVCLFEIGFNEYDFKLENLLVGFYVVKVINKVELF